MTTHRAAFRTCQTSKIKSVPDIVNSFQPLTIYTKRFILEVWDSSEYASDSERRKLCEMP